MILLRKLSEFRAPTYDLSILEKSAVVWHTTLTQQNIHDLSRVQISACKILLRNKYHDYNKSLEAFRLENWMREEKCFVECLKLKVQGRQEFLSK